MRQKKESRATEKSKRKDVMKAGGGKCGYERRNRRSSGTNEKQETPNSRRFVNVPSQELQLLKQVGGREGGGVKEVRKGHEEQAKETKRKGTEGVKVNGSRQTAEK